LPHTVHVKSIRQDADNDYDRETSLCVTRSVTADTSRRRVLVAITAVGEQHSDISVNTHHMTVMMMNEDVSASCC